MFGLWPSALDNETQVRYMLMTELFRTDLLYKSSLVSRIKFWNIRLQDGSFGKWRLCVVHYHIPNDHIHKCSTNVDLRKVIVGIVVSTLSSCPWPLPFSMLVYMLVFLAHNM